MTDSASADLAPPAGQVERLTRHWPGWARVMARVMTWLFGLGLAAALAGALLVAIALSLAYPNLPEIGGLSEYRPKLPLRVISVDGVLLGEFGEERRSFTPIGQIPKVLKNAVLAIEDAHFYEHGGVDYKGVLRAGVASLTEFKSQGASTITMQLARNFFLSTEKTFTRKIYEILLALKIESQLTKEQILEIYMNQIYLGQRAYGFAAASEIYFGKSLGELTIAEAAMLAGLPKAPSAYNPIANPKRARARQQHIIDRMAENSFISQEQAELARQQTLRYRVNSEPKVHGEFVAETVRQLIFAHYGDEAYSRGLNVHVTVNAADQEVAYRALRRGLLEFELRQLYRGPEAYVDLPSDPKELDARIAEALMDHPDNDELRAAVVVEASPRRVVAVLQSGEAITASGEGLRPVTSGLSERAGPKTRIRPGAVVRALRGPKGEWTLTQQPEVEGAFVSLDPHDGTIRAMVGGFDFDKSKFNHVTQAWRQPGSSFKPFIYSAALEKGFTPLTVINDAPLFFDASATGSQPWEPKNYDGKFEGPMPLRQALASSKNMVSIRILQAIGPSYAQDWITRFGFEAEKHPAYLTMALGAGTVTPLQMASAYSVFANGGFRVNPQLIVRVTDSKGRVIRDTRPVALDESMRAIDDRNAFMMTQLLQEVTRSGTAAKARALKRVDIAGKTGTTNDSMDAWFAGFQRSLVAVVWIGYDTPRKLGDRETGGGLALPVWMEYMGHALRGVPTQTTRPPEGVVLHGNNWMYEEFGPGAGVASLGLEDQLPQTPSEDERKGILDLFRR
jgi:penicillin-binding protein 1A